MSDECTTQGDPLAMPMYALATIPLLKQLPSDVENKSGMKMTLVPVIIKTFQMVAAPPVLNWPFF